MALRSGSLASTEGSWADLPLLSGLDGAALGAPELTAALRKAGDLGPAGDVLVVEVVPGTELRWPQSHSGKLRLQLREQAGLEPVEKFLYLKKIVPKGLPRKSLHALRRDLASNQTEARFYQEIAPRLAERGVPLLRALLVESRLSLGAAGDEAEQERELRTGGLLLLLDSAEGYWQTSPLPLERAVAALALLARFHAAAWQDTAMLADAASRLHGTGGYWTLEKRGEAETGQLRSNWQQYVSTFKAAAPELLGEPEIVALAERVDRLAPEVAKRLAPAPVDRFATLIHGDYKAMNVFLLDDRRGEAMAAAPALPIDFQWTGVGLGMSDVAMHVSHSVAVDVLASGEERLLEAYRMELLKAMAGRGVDAEGYTAKVAREHYCLGVVDYARMVIGCFFKGASPEAFAGRAELENVGLAYRNVEASLLFVRRVDRCLRELEGSSRKRARTS